MKMRSKVITFINKCRKLLFKLNVILPLAKRLLMWLSTMVKLPNVTYSTIILTGTCVQENLLINRFEEKDSFKDIWLAGSCFLCMLNRETFSTFINQERPGADFTFTVTFLLFGGYY